MEGLRPLQTSLEFFSLEDFKLLLMSSAVYTRRLDKADGVLYT